MLTQNRLREVLSYDPVTGLFRWLVARGQNRVGDRAGTQDLDGYRSILFEGKRYKEHRLAWLYVYGRWPSLQLDHKNNIRNCNSIDNLREATPSTNQFNSLRSIRNKSGFKGVCWHPKRGWRAYICKDGKVTELGYYMTPEEAFIIRSNAAEKLHGEFVNAG
jgi:hypothetical protein